MDFLIVTNRRDLTSDYIVRELRRRNLRYRRLNTETIGLSSLEFDPLRGSFELEQEGRKLRLQDVKAAYFRRPQPPELRPGIAQQAETYCRNEWFALLKSLYLFLEERWLSHPNAILLAEDKPRQLRLAKSLGFRVPGTLISNAPRAVEDFVATGTVVGKPLRHALFDDGDEQKVMFTTRLAEVPDGNAVSAAPVIYQEEIRKRIDVRATVVADRVFAAGIHSQETDETAVDWRRGSNPKLKHEILGLPEDVRQACVGFVRGQNLRFGAIDLVLDEEGNYWFLECNPNGQWAWIENRTGLPIASAIVDELEEIARQ